MRNKFLLVVLLQLTVLYSYSNTDPSHRGRCVDIYVTTFDTGYRFIEYYNKDGSFRGVAVFDITGDKPKLIETIGDTSTNIIKFIDKDKLFDNNSFINDRYDNPDFQIYDDRIMSKTKNNSGRIIVFDINGNLLFNSEYDSDFVLDLNKFNSQQLIIISQKNREIYCNKIFKGK